MVAILTKGPVTEVAAEAMGGLFLRRREGDDRPPENPLGVDVYFVTAPGILDVSISFSIPLSICRLAPNLLGASLFILQVVPI
jgi:hypothetical protein